MGHTHFSCFPILLKGFFWHILHMIKQSRYLGSCRCNSWATHTYRCITSAAPPAPSGVRKHRWGLQVHHHDLAIYDSSHWTLRLYLYNWMKQTRDHFLLPRPSICFTLIKYIFFSPQIQWLYPHCLWGLVPFIYYPFCYWERERFNWDRVNWHRTKSHEGEICRLHEDCKPFSSCRPVLFAWMDMDMSQGSILTVRWGISLRNKVF